jgi:DNA repair protein RecN (Recombination protein N)
MLLELKVSHFAIIDNIHIEFGQGLNILSGETGAGKSILLKSLGLLMGAKGSIESIRSGHLQASIEGSFDLSDRPDLKSRLEQLGIAHEDDLLIVRRVLSEGKSRVYLNGVLSPLNALRDLVSPLIEVAGQAAPLIEMTGQFDNRHLLSKSYHLDLLDQYVGAWDQRSQYAKVYGQWQDVLSEIEEFKRSAQDKSQRLDFLRFQRDEINALDLNPGEDFEIEGELKLLKASTRLVQFVSWAEDSLDGPEDSSVQRLQKVIQKAHELSNVDPAMNARIEGLIQAKTLIEDSLFELRGGISKLEADAGRLEQLESRLSQIRKLQKKHGPSVDDIIRSLIEMETELGQLENSEQHLKELETRATAMEKDLRKQATDLSKRRQGGSHVLANSVNEELKDLNMKGVTLFVETTRLERLTPTGLDEVEFQTQTSKQDPRRPLAKVASGGELSRILLSLKQVMGAGRFPRTYLFDEVDTGVSGETAEKVGRKLKSIGKGQQVICVTHLPQVAAAGDNHFSIQKNPGDKSVSMEVRKLLKKDRVQEIARLISGEKITKTSIAHAEELLR